MADKNQKVREDRIRRWGYRLGIRLEKSRGHFWHHNHGLGWRIFDLQGACLAGEHYDLSLDQVETFLNAYEVRLTT